MIVFLLRHADKKLQAGADDLSPAGLERARILARMLAETGISVAYCSTARRTEKTLKPLKAVLGNGLSIRKIKIDDIGRHVDDTVADIALLPSGAVVAVVGHTNTVPLIIGKLGGGAIEPIEETEFDKLFVLADGANGKTLLRLRYGAPT